MLVTPVLKVFHTVRRAGPGGFLTHLMGCAFMGRADAPCAMSVASSALPASSAKAALQAAAMAWARDSFDAKLAPVAKCSSTCIKLSLPRSLVLP